MTASPRTHHTAVLLALLWIGGTAPVLSPALGQPPAPGTRDEHTGTAAGKPGAADLDKLQGRWHITALTVQGKTFAAKDRPNGWNNVFQKDVVIQGDRFSHTQPVGASTFQLDGARNPKQITFRDKEGQLTFRGIYALAGDTLTVCVNGDGTDVRRPEEFVTREGTPLLLIVLKKGPAPK